jgi:beta-glucosidase/6-phospho-beta-glucosidase/beta-galactosidase
MSLEQIGAFESTYMPAHDVDVLETSGHVARWREDLARLRDHGVTRLRYPIRWHRIEARQGSYDWAETDRLLHHMRAEGMRPIVDLVHHTSYPRWLAGGFADERFGPAYVAYCEAFARRYDWIEEYTLFNEPFATLFLAGHEGIWPPFGRGLDALVELFLNVVPAIGEASRRVRALLPDARHVYVDTCEGHRSLEPAADGFTAMANDRRFFVVDLLLGRPLERDRPFVAEVAATRLGPELLGTEPGHLDVLGLDYYAHSEWAFKRRATPLAAGGRHERHHQDSTFEGVTPSPVPQGLAELARQYGARYGELPMLLSETNVRGAASDRATWLKHTLEQCEQARAGGVPLEAYCWFPFLDSLDWNSLLEHADGCIDPVGVLWLDADLERHESTMSASYRRAAAGASAAELPAYRFSEPVAEWVSALLPLMDHFDWQEPPTEEVASFMQGIVRANERREAA